MISNEAIEEKSVYFMQKVVFSISILLLLFACNIADASKEKSKQEPSPNFIFILADDQGWNGTSVQMMHNEPGSKSDYFETPNLELLAKRRIRFSDAYAVAPVCAP